MLQFLASLILVPSLLSFLPSADASSPVDITARTGPTLKDWAHLNATVGGRLFPGVPWTEPCFSIYNGKKVKPDVGQCSFVQQNFFNHIVRTGISGAYGTQNFEMCMRTGDQCQINSFDLPDPFAFTPPRECRQGSIPDFFIDVKGKEDVIAALNFVKKTGVPLVIKNTGHDFKGRSSAPGSLSLWTHNLKYISHNAKFVPEGCHNVAAQQALTYGAGQQFQEIYEFANAHGLEVVGGADQTVGGAGGWAQGGGHSTLTPSLGMGVDRALQYKVVTPDGVFRTVNSCQNSDLFFALRGGGGGTFAIVLEATVMASPSQTFRVANINWPINNDNMKKMLALFVENSTTLATQQWGGFFTPSIGNLVLINPKLNMAQAKKVMQPLIDLSTSLGGVSNVTEFPNYLAWFNAYAVGLSGNQDSLGVPHAMTTRLIPQKNYQTPAGRVQTVNALANALEITGFSQITLTTPIGFKGTDGKDTSITPIWRTSLHHVILVQPFAYNSTLAEIQATYALGTKAINFLRDITPGSGAYVNEADIHEPNHEVSFWGDNFPRLLQIKNKYDPHRILDCWHCVGWKGPSSPQFKCYI
ncbi:hypothetical protein GALMADRAFT_632193 [Galerina marginata CBS 339.88]|uniref:FAD-binding PCMH-type domain-containing protein n=1 Tax=Galerina marginata (strain CBS 339.88) TaxID=685588 RepID=A0A067SS51_GALM3|nr:hypothetical protein GALMADRAFT_632193 [Galerina marginata CBS 339.88]